MTGRAPQCGVTRDRPRRRFGALLTALAMFSAIAVGAVVAGPASGAADVDAGPLRLDGCDLPGLIPAEDMPDGFEYVDLHFKGAFPDQVAPGEEFTVSDVEVIVQMESPVLVAAYGSDDQGPRLDFGDWGSAHFPPPERDLDTGLAVVDGKIITGLDEITLTAPSETGATPVPVIEVQYKDNDDPLPPITCYGDPGETIVTTLMVGSGEPAGATKLNVVTSPAVASQITVDGLIVDTWGVNDLDVDPGSHEVCFSDVAGFITPDCETVEVVEGETAEVTGQFETQAWLNVSTSPAVNAQISIDGSPANNWGVHGLPVAPGDHEVCFGDVADFATPECEVITVSEGEIASVTGEYTDDAGAPGPDGVGMLRVTTDPAVASVISVDGAPADTWGLDWLQLDPGEHEVCFSDVAGLVAPACETVTVSDGQTTEVTGAFSTDSSGMVDVRVEPAVDAPITVTKGDVEVARGNWGMDITLDAGDYQFCFAETAAGDVPAESCVSETVVAGALTTVTMAYNPVEAD